MDSAAQVDLARNEAPANQVMASALGEALAHNGRPPSPTASAYAGNELQKTVSRGSSAITSQVRLNSKNPSHDLDIDDSRLNNQDFGESGQGGAVATLQPVDEGFGAWSYVASAFAMYIVVWGMLFPSNCFRPLIV